MKKVAVVGGGITGLAAAFQLHRAGLEPLVFEAGATGGGVIRSHRDDGFLVEAGPNSLQETPGVRELIDAVDLTAEVVEAGPAAKNRYIVRDGRLVPLPMSPPALLRSPLLSWKGKLRLLKEPFVRPAPAESDESLAAFVRRRLGGEALDYLVNPFIAGIFAGDPEKLSARHALPRLFDLEQKHGSLFRGLKAARTQKKSPPRLISFRDGLASLPGALAQKLKGRIYFETSVETITARENGWELIATRYGRRLRDTYDAIVFALPADALARLAFDKEGAPVSLKPLAQMPHPPVASVSLGFKRDQIRHPLDGFGMLIPEKERRQVLGTLFPSTLFPERAPAGQVLLTTFVGGTRQPELAQTSEANLRRIVMEDLRALLGVTGDPVFSSIHLWPRAIPQYETGHETFLRAIDAFETQNPGLFLAGPVRDGISLGQCIASGQKQADRAKQYLEQP